MTSPRDRDRLELLWRAHAARVHAYAARHVGIDRAEDVLAETFIIAWRRLPDVPDAALPWLLTTARHLSMTTHRRHRREVSTAARLAQVAPPPGASPDQQVVDRAAALTALAALSDGDREALLLTAWDGLSPTDAAAVLGCSDGTFRVRLHRARARLATALEAAAHDPGTSTLTPLPFGRLS